MKKNISKKTIGLLVVSLLMVACIGVGSALAYFTTYTEAKGGLQLDLEFVDTKINEDVEKGEKILTVKNNENAEDAYVRIKVVVAEQYKEYLNDLAYSELEGVENWKPGEGGYYYYKPILAPGETTTELFVNISGIKATDDFNVIVIQESTPVLYDADGEPYADWTVTAQYQESVDMTPEE